MRILAMDTATSAMTIAVTDQGQMVRGTVVATERNHSIRLAPEIDQILERSGTARKELQGIACGVGPGSYTGVRIGVTVAKTMAWALQLPVWEVSSMQVLAWSGWVQHNATTQRTHDSVWVIPLADARRGQAFTGCYAWDGVGRLLPVSEDRVAPALDWVKSQFEHAAASGIQAILLTGELDTFQTLKQWLEEEQSARSLAWTWLPTQASAEGLNKAVHDSISLAKQTAVNVHDLVPNYTQLAEAESKWLAGKSAGKDV